MRRSLAGALLALMLAAALICPAWGEDFRPLLENRPLTAGDSVSDWLAVASGRAGLQRPDYLRDLESYVTSMYRENGGLDRIKATEWHRITLAVQAQGGDPTALAGTGRESPSTWWQRGPITGPAPAPWGPRGSTAGFSP